MIEDGLGTELQYMAGRRMVRLKRVSDTATEGRFTCKISKDGNDAVRGLLILHPSESLQK